MRVPLQLGLHVFTISSIIASHRGWIMEKQYSTTVFIKVWYFCFTVLCVAVNFLLPPSPLLVPWRAGILILALFGVYHFMKSLTLYVRVEEDRVLLNQGVDRERVLGWGQISRVECRDIGKQHAVRIYTNEGLVLETNSRWLERLDELTDSIVSKARLSHRDTTGSRLMEGIWEVWTV